MNKKYTGLFEDVHSISDIIFAMVAGLEKEWVNVDMETYGTTRFGETIANEKNMCFGCAATNTLCQLMGKPFDSSNIHSVEERASLVNFGIPSDVVYRFEQGVDKLRVGDIDWFLSHIKALEKELGFAVKVEEILCFSSTYHLPILYNEDFKEYLPIYKEFALDLKKEGY
jgi:hypothetical protein